MVLHSRFTSQPLRRFSPLLANAPNLPLSFLILFGRRGRFETCARVFIFIFSLFLCTLVLKSNDVQDREREKEGEGRREDGCLEIALPQEKRKAKQENEISSSASAL